MAKRKTKKQGKNWKKFWKLGSEDFNTQFFSISKDGELAAIEGHHIYNLHDLARKYGTPLQVIFPFVLEDRLKDLLGYFQAYMKIYNYKGKFFYHYPMKVNQNKEFVLPLISEGANLEVTSANELWLVKKLWEGEKFNSKIRVLCNGPKTDQYIDLIEELRAKSLNIVPIIEGPEEMVRIVKYKGDIGVRVDLSIKSDTRWDKKFDRFGLSEKDILDLPKMKNLKILHYHLGSQIKTQKSILDAIKHAFSIYVQLQKTHPSLDTLDIGGGFGIPHEKKKKFYTAKVVSSKIIKLLKNLSDKAGIKHPNLVVEWGWYIVDPAQVTIYKVISKKYIEKANAKAWYIIDGSFMNDLKDTWAVHQKWHTIPVNNMHNSLKRVWLAGSSCDSDDKYTAGGDYILLPKLNGEEQYVAILDTGAYQDSLASHHCLLSLPAKIIAKDGAIKIVRKHESAESVGKLFGWVNENHK